MIRLAGRDVMLATYEAAAAYSACRPTAAAVGLGGPVMSLVRYLESVRGYVIALWVSYRPCAAASVRFALKPNRRFASRCRVVRSGSSGARSRSSFLLSLVITAARPRHASAIACAAAAVVSQRPFL